MINIKEISLSQGKITLVDDDMYEELSKYKWYYGNDGYAVRKSYFDNDLTKDIFMHRVIANTPDYLLTDHIDGDKLNNQKSNLRHCTNQQNQWNQKPREGLTSQYKGVIKRKYGFEVNVSIDGKPTYLGSFSNELAAANAYNHYAKIYYGEFAWLNDVPFMEKNIWESFKKSNKTGKYIGVYWSKKVNKWESSIYMNKKQKFIGYFETPEDAVLARNQKIIEWGLNEDKIQQII